MISMRLLGFAVLAGILWIPPALAAGIQMIDIPADDAGPALHGAIWSPCAEPPAQPGQAVRDCPISGENLPLVVISHGRGGTFNGHQDTAETLADAGFVVAAINHPGDTATDMSHFFDLSVYIERPTDIKRLIDFMLDASSATAKIDPQRLGLFGFSRGGYTGLVVIGANPDWAHVTSLCEGDNRHICDQIRNKEYPDHPLTHDPRIKAAVLADPLSVPFTAESFAAVKTPVRLWASERGGDGVEPGTVTWVDKNLPAPHEYHVVLNSTHFAFLTPCPPELAAKRPEHCTDPPGFDRVAFHKEFDAAVLAFFRSNLREH
jgi:predicted dienelactone hydrolase